MLHGIPVVQLRLRLSTQDEGYTGTTNSSAAISALSLAFVSATLCLRWS